MKYYIAGIFSIVALIFYSLPWLYGATHEVLGLYIIAFFWFIVAGWIVLIFQLYLFLLFKKRNNPLWKSHLISSFLIIFSYVGFMFWIFNGFMLTV